MFPWSRDKKRTTISAIVVGDENPFPPSQRIPIIMRSIEVLHSCRKIGEIIITCGDQEIADYFAAVLDDGFDRVSQIVVGGGDWLSSIRKGASEASGSAGYYLFHDGMRPLLSSEMVEDCIAEALRYGAARAGVPVLDEARFLGADGCAADTPERGALVLLQTPWVIERQRYHSGEWRSRISLGERDNIRLETPDDLALAQALLLGREGILIEDGLLL